MDISNTIIDASQNQIILGATDLIASHCYLHPETAEQFVKDKLANPTSKNHKEYFESLGLERAN